jgi:flagellin
MNSHRNLLINNSGTAKNLEKLSSGYRVNRAGDDAAGLAISEKMRGQIRGLDMATRNAQNGVSLIQTAEGALNETHAILQRMRELAVQSSNGTYQEEVDRANLDQEVQALKSEIERISTSTHYNGIKLIDGSMTDAADTSAARPQKYTDPTTAGNQPLNITDHSIKADEGTAKIGDTTFELEDADLSGPDGLTKIDGTTPVTAEEMTFQIGANGSGDQKVNLSVTNMGVWNLGDRTMVAADIKADGTSTTKLTGNMVAHVDISNRSKAKTASRRLTAPRPLPPKR